MREKWYQEWIKEEFPEAETLRTEGEANVTQCEILMQLVVGQRRS